MKTIRIIPRLDIKGPNLVKGIHLEGLLVLRKPENFARYYYENGADELIYQDVVASLYERNSLKDIISRTARQIFIPLIVHSGAANIQHIETALNVEYVDAVALGSVLQQVRYHLGYETVLCSDATGRKHSDCLILPRVGAFGDAMNQLDNLSLTEPIKDFAASGNPLMSICLDMQLLFDQSQEFGSHSGLGMIKGEICRFQEKMDEKKIKAPQIGWNRIFGRQGTMGQPPAKRN